VIIICPDRYRQPPTGRVPPHPARHRSQPAAKRSPQPVKQPLGCADEDETSSMITNITGTDLRPALHAAVAA
jgi:hypothetical protein